MFGKRNLEKPRRKAARHSPMTTESPEAIFDEAVGAVQRLRLRGHIDQESADALMKFLLAGYVNYTIHQLANEVFTDDFLDSLVRTGLPENE